MVTVDVRSDGSERVKYDYNGYFAYIRRGLLSRYPNYAADSHWHDDLEFISILSGSMWYNVNGELILLKQGEGILVNARQLHYGFSSTREECEFFCVLLHPMLLCATQNMDHDHVSPFLTDEGIPYVLLHHDVPWQQKILDAVQYIHDVKNNTAAPLHIQRTFYDIWILLTENISIQSVAHGKGDKRLALLKDMLGFIHKRYADAITLADIAQAGKVSKSTCLAVFRQYLHETPVNYLISYRLKIAANYLQDTSLSISEIALSTGFTGISYFSETFRKKYDCSPGVYRNKVTKE